MYSCRMFLDRGAKMGFAEFTHGICPECAKKLYSEGNFHEEDKK
jgi:hypothetical protein